MVPSVHFKSISCYRKMLWHEIQYLPSFIIHHSLLDSVTENLEHVSFGYHEKQNKHIFPHAIPIQPDLIPIELYDVLTYFIFLASD